MNADQPAWDLLRERAAGLIRPGFPERVMRAERAGRRSAPSRTGQFVVCATFAGLCLLAVVAFNGRSSGDENSRSRAGWQEISAQADALDQSQAL